MYCSRLEYVDESLRHLGYSRIPSRMGFSNALVENVATGCTIVLNRQARNLITQNFPRHALLHDWWSYLVISAFGKVDFDPRPAIKYRQHSNNRVGATTSHAESLKRRFERFVRQDGGARLLIDQAEDFHRCFGRILSTKNKANLGTLSFRSGTACGQSILYDSNGCLAAILV